MHITNVVYFSLNTVQSECFHPKTKLFNTCMSDLLPVSSIYPKTSEGFCNLLGAIVFQGFCSKCCLYFGIGSSVRRNWNYILVHSTGRHFNAAAAALNSPYWLSIKGWIHYIHFLLRRRRIPTSNECCGKYGE